MQAELGTSMNAGGVVIFEQSIYSMISPLAPLSKFYERRAYQVVPGTLLYLHYHKRYKRDFNRSLPIAYYKAPAEMPREPVTIQLLNITVAAAPIFNSGILVCFASIANSSSRKYGHAVINEV
jgi:hypothetical protein